MKKSKVAISCCVIISILLAAAGVTNSYTNFLTIVVLKIHIYHISLIYKCNFLTFKFRQNSKNHAQNHDRFFSSQRFNEDIKNPLQKYKGNEQQRKRPDLNMTETWLDISVPEIWWKLDRIAKIWYNTFPQNVNVTETWNSMFFSRLRNVETWDFVLCSQNRNHDGTQSCSHSICWS